MREKRKLNKGQLGRAIGRTPNTIRDYESGKISPSLGTLFILGAALNCSTHKLLWGTK